MCCHNAIKCDQLGLNVNLPGTGDTVIKKAVPSGGDLCIALRQVEACDFPKRGKLGCAIFGSGGLRSRIPLHKTTQIIITITVTPSPPDFSLIERIPQNPFVHVSEDFVKLYCKLHFVHVQICSEYFCLAVA